MAMAVQKLFPDAKVTIGPWIENGFYYDFDMEPLTDKDLKRIKKEMVSTICSQVSFMSFFIVWKVVNLEKYSLAGGFRVWNLFVTSSVGSHHWSKFTTD